MQNKRKNATMLCLALLSFSLTMPAQFYLGFSSGYQYGILRQYLGLAYISNGNTQIDGYQSVIYSLGQGWLNTVNAGYRYNEKLSFELDCSYLYGQQYKTNYDPYFVTDDVYCRATVLRISPAIKFHTTFKNFRPYLLAGPSIGFIPVLKTRESYQQSQTTYILSRYSGRQAIGCLTKIGLNWDINETWVVNGYLSGIFQNWSPYRSKVTEWKSNGYDVLSSKPLISVESIYTKDPKLSSSINQPAQRQLITFPFSSCGLMIGVEYHFSHPKEKNPPKKQEEEQLK